MNKEEGVRLLANLADQLERMDLRGEETPSGTRAWAFVFRSLTDEESDQLLKMEVTQLYMLLVIEPQKTPLGRKVQELFEFYETWTTDSLCKDLAEMSDYNMNDPAIWEYLFSHMPLTPADYKMLKSMKQGYLEAFAMAEDESALGEKSLYPDIEKEYPNFLELDKRIGQVFRDFEDRYSGGDDSWRTAM